MPISVSIKLDTSRFKALLTDVEKRQVPFATSTALNLTAFQIQKAENAETKLAFKNPRPFSQRAFAVIKSTKTTQCATVYLKQDHQYIEPFILGGKHIIEGNQSLRVPVEMRTDQYGQITRQAFKTLVARADAKGSAIFFGTVKGITGWWQRPVAKQQAKGGDDKKPTPLKLLLRFEENQEVVKTLPFLQSAEADAMKYFAVNWWSAFTRAMRTANV